MFQSDLHRDSASDKSTSIFLLFSPLPDPEPEPEPDLPRESFVYTGLTYSERVEPPLPALTLKGLVRGEGVVGCVLLGIRGWSPGSQVEIYKKQV